MTRRHFIISGANDVHLPGPSSSLSLLPANNSSFFTMFAITCVPAITLSTISVNLFKCHLDTEWFLFIYHIYCVYYILFNLFKCHLGTEWLLSTLGGESWQRQSSHRILCKRKLVTFAHQNFVFTIDKVAALLKIGPKQDLN